MAAKIGHDINSTGAKLQQLARRMPYDEFLTLVAKRKTLFDDKSTQIAELIYVIKHDIAELNNDIGSLQTFVKQRRSNGRQKGKKEVDEHSENVVVLLQSKLANTSMGFKDVLEIRTQVCPP
jgi:syntaxin 5